MASKASLEIGLISVTASNRPINAGLKFQVRDDIQAGHLWHPRGDLSGDTAKRNLKLFIENRRNKVKRCKNGLNR